MRKILNTKNLICLTVIGAPLYLIKFEVFNIPTNVLEFFIGITFIFWLIETVGGKTKRINFHILLSILLILSGLLISTLINNNYRVGFGIIKGWFILPIVFGVLIYNITTTKNSLVKILDCIFLSSLLVSIFSLIYYFSGISTFDGRLQAFYLSPNHLAMFLAPGLLIGLLSLLHSRANVKIKSLLIIGILIIAISLYLTYSYATWISIIIAFFISLTIANKSGLLSISYRKIILAFFLLTMILLFVQQNSPKFQDLINLNERSSFSSRIIIWKSSLKILSDNWILGIGPGNFQEKYLEYQKYFPPYLEWAVPQPHSFYLAFWLQTGILGILGIFWLLYTWIKIQFLHIKQAKEKQLTCLLLAVMFYFLIHGIVDTTYWKNDLSLIFWIIIFLGIIPFPNPPASQEQ